MDTQISSNNSNECPKCNKPFANKYSLKTHMASTVSCKEPGVKPTPLQCEHCNRQFVHKARYETHIKVCPAKEKSEISLFKNKEPTDTKNKDAKNSSRSQQLVIVEPARDKEIQKSEGLENKKLLRKIEELEKSLDKEKSRVKELEQSLEKYKGIEFDLAHARGQIAGLINANERYANTTTTINTYGPDSDDTTDSDDSDYGDPNNVWANFNESMSVFKTNPFFNKALR